RAHVRGRQGPDQAEARSRDRTQQHARVPARGARAWPQGRNACEQRPATSGALSMKKPKVKITPAAIAAFRRAISDEGAAADEGTVHDALGLPIWHATVFSVDRDQRPDWIKPEEWQRARELRQRLLQAMQN